MPSRIWVSNGIESQPATWTIDTSTTLIDGGAPPYNAVQPGDIIELDPGTRPPLNIKDLAGTADNPIIIRNGNGVVVINSSSGWFGFWIQNCQHFRFTGSGYGQTYGIQIVRSQNNGIIFQNKTDNFEMDHIEILRVDNEGIGMQGQTTATVSPDYDYDLDGDIDVDDGTINRSNYSQYNFHVHHVHMDGGEGTNLIGTGMYFGNSNYLEDSTQPLIYGCRVHDNIIENIGHKAIQVGSVIESCYVYNNVITNASQTLTVSTNKIAININPGCTGAKVYNNVVTDAIGTGIWFYGEGGTIYNNILVRCGRTGTSYEEGITVTYKGGYSHSENTYIFNNTIIDPISIGVEFGIGYGSDDRIQNNVVVNPGSSYFSYPAGNFTVSNNLTTMTIADCYFTDESSDDYTLTANSPAINTGADISSFGVTDDIIGTARPQFTYYDEGAYESLVDYEAP